MSVSPRINSAMVATYINRPVRIVGIVQGYDATKAQMSLLASDNQLVNILVAPQNVGVTWEVGQILEVIGQAQGNQTPTIQEFTSIPFTKNFDLNNYERLVQLIHNEKNSHMFH